MTETSSRQEKRSLNSSGKQKIKLVAVNARYVHSCLALFYIRHELAIHYPQADVEILQLTINDNSYESLLQITGDKPFAVFFSAAIWNSDRVVQLAGDVHGCLPDCRIVVGGPQAGVLRAQLPDDVCSVVRGEIEAVGLDFYSDLVSGHMQPLYEGKFFGLKNRQLSYPFRDEDFSAELQNRYIYYETSRGCPHACTYCLSASEAGLYHKELDQVKKELRHILQYNPRVVRFVDRTFNDRPSRALTIWEFLIEQQCDTLFHFEIAPDRFTEEMFVLLEKIEHGRFQFEIGIQSTNDETLRAINRRMDAEMVHPIIKRLAALDTIHLHVDLILGLPHDTSESFATSFSEVFAMGAHYIQMGLLKILPDTPICHSAEDYGYVHSEHPPYSVLATNWLSHEQIHDLYWFCECVEKFYNNRYFVSLWRYLRDRREDMFVFFQLLLQEGQKIGFLHRAATQQLLCEILVNVCRERFDYTLIQELLRYDWLRCGFRKLPDCLLHGEGEEDLTATKGALYESLPENIPEVFNSAQRSQLFKRSVFLHLTEAAAEVLGFSTSETRIALLQEREKTLYEHNRVIPFEKFPAETG